MSVSKEADCRRQQTPGRGMPLVSVVIPTCNRAGHVVRALRSVIGQTYRHLEIIVVDDGSMDETERVVRALGDQRIRYIRHEHRRGGAAARNTGIRAATGEFIAFLDDDDEWRPAKTEAQLSLLRRFPAVACDSIDRRGPHPHRRPHRDTLSLEDLTEGPWGGVGVLMARSDAVKSVMFDESLPLGQDWDFFIRLAEEHRIGYLDVPLLEYDSGDHPRITNARRDMSVAAVEQALKVVHKHRQLFGAGWFRRQMCRGMLYGLKDRRDKGAMLLYTARRYGALNVLRVLGGRAYARWPRQWFGAIAHRAGSESEGAA